VIPSRYAPYLFGLLLSGMMSCLISGLSTVRALGLVDGVVGSWMANWLASWAVASPSCWSLPDCAAPGGQAHRATGLDRLSSIHAAFHVAAD
jgi:hypothetical protein